MTAKTNTQRGEALRKRRAAAGLAEVRGIWAPPELHAEIRELAAKLQRRRERVEGATP